MRVAGVIHTTIARGVSRLQAPVVAYASRAMTIPMLLDELLRAHGASGREDDVQAIVRREAAAAGAEVTGDVLGATIARVRGTGPGRTLALVAHTDQIALGLTRLDDDGLVQVGALGTWKAEDLVGQRFSIRTATGLVPAVGVRRGTGEPGWEDVRLELGVRTRDEAAALVTPGDVAVFAVEPRSLAGDRFTAAAIDNRASLYAGLELVRRFASEPAGWDVVLVASVQEETGRRAAAEASVAACDVEVALVLESSYASDAPFGYPPWGEVPLGGGASVFRGPVVHPTVTDGLLSAAAAIGRPAPVETGTTTSTDGDDLFTLGGGLPVGLIAVPVRYMHTAHEVAALGDVESLVEIVETYVRSLGPAVSFVR